MKRHAKPEPPPPPLEKLQVAIGFLKIAGMDRTPQEAIGLPQYNKLMTKVFKTLSELHQLDLYAL